MTSKKLKKIFAGISLTAFLAGATLIGIGDTHAEQEGDVERGKMLFNDPTLGGSTNEKSCGTCHPEGKGLENSAGNIAGIVNLCLQKPLAGEGLDVDSQEMKDIIAYIKSLRK